MYLTSLVTTRIELAAVQRELPDCVIVGLRIELAAVQRKLPDCVIVGLQLYSARTFCVTLSPQIYKGGQGPPPNNHQHLGQYKQHRRYGITQTCGPNLSKSLCSLYHRVLEQSIPTYKPYC